MSARPVRSWFSRGCLLPLGLAALIAGADVAALPRESVAISATAAPIYARTLRDGRARPQSYSFMRGRYFSGQWRIRGLEQVSFEELLPALATGLAQQNFLPAHSPAEADLVIVVHWGITDIYEDPRPQEDMIAELNAGLATAAASARGSGIADLGPLDATLREFDGIAYSKQSAVQKNAALLGYGATLAKEQRKPFPSAEEYRMTAELNESRYFVVLMAYQAHPRTKGGKAGLLWSTRLSIRANGTNFAEAFPVLVHAGGQVFGRQLDGLLHVQPKTAVPGVDLGELQILGPAEYDERDGKPPR